MSKKALLPQKSRHVLLYEEDWEYLNEVYGRYSSSKLGVSEAIRTVVHAWVRKLRNREIEMLDSRQPPAASHQPPEENQ